MGGTKRSKYNDAALETIVERLRKLADGLEDVSRSGTAMTDICKKNDWDYRNTRRALEMFLKIDQKTNAADKLSEALDYFDGIPIEKLYCEVFGVRLGSPELDTVLTRDPKEQNDIWNWIMDGADGGLTPRELQCLEAHCTDDYTLDETAKLFGVTRERIRQILVKAYRKLRHPRRANILRYGLDYISEESKLREESMRKRREELKGRLSEEEKDFFIRKPMSIDNLDLSVRSYNCLYRVGIDNVDQIKDMSFERLARIRNLGRKSLKEIIEAMRTKVDPDFLADVDLSAF